MTTTRTRAAAAIVALANRHESAGKKPCELVGGPEWTPMPFCAGMMMHRGHLTSALEYYEIAESLDPAIAGYGLQRALLCETLGDWQAAIRINEGLRDSVYADAAAAAIDRCRDKSNGVSPASLTAQSLQQVLDWEDHDAGITYGPSVVSLAQARRRRQVDSALVSSGFAEQAEQAALVAATFVNLLLDRQWQAAHAMLVPEHADSDPKLLQQSFEQLFDDEPFPISADVFDVQTDLEHLDDADLGWVYVSIPSEHAEAVSLVVTRHQADYRVRDVAFGRP